MAALFRGVSVVNVLSTSNVRVSCIYTSTISPISVNERQRQNKESQRKHTRAVLSLLLVIKYERSGLNCKSVTTSICALSFDNVSSPSFQLNRATFPDSCPVTINEGVCANAQSVGFEPIGWNFDSGSFDSIRKETKWSACYYLFISKCIHFQKKQKRREIR